MDFAVTPDAKMPTAVQSLYKWHQSMRKALEIGVYRGPHRSIIELGLRGCMNGAALAGRRRPAANIGVITQGTLRDLLFNCYGCVDPSHPWNAPDLLYQAVGLAMKPASERCLRAESIQLSLAYAPVHFCAWFGAIAPSWT